MSRPALLLAAAFAGLVGLGCREQDALTDPASPLPLLASARQRPDNPGGAIIERGIFLIGFWFSDPKRGLTVLTGVPASEISSLSACGGGTGEPEPQEFFGVVRPTGAHKVLLRNRETTVAVWQFTVGTSLDDLCGVLGTSTPYAEGVAKFRYVDNDFELPIEPGANSARWDANGRVTVLETGEVLHLHASTHTIIPPGGTFEDLRQLQSEIRLN